MKNGKLIILFLALALPVLIFLFLKFFGKNQFDLPVFHSDDTDWPAECPAPTTYPYLPNLNVLLPEVTGKPVVILLADPEPEAATRIPVEIDTTALALIHTAKDLDPCLFGAPSGTSAVIIDANGAIRGIFAALDRDEADRLIMESKILLKDY